MAISLSCPSCDKTLKVKDELAGRKVKCPGCGEAVPVPAGDEAAVVAAEKLPRGKPLPVEDEEDRPRKKKKKKKSNLGLWIGVGGGGLALLLLIGCGIGAFFYFKTPGEKKLDDQAKAKPEPKREDDGKIVPPPPPPQKEGRGTGIYGARERPLVQNDLKQLVLFMQQAELASGKTPKDVKAFVNSIKREAPALAKDMESGYYVIVPNTPFSSEFMVAYEGPADAVDLHVVVMGSTVHEELCTTHKVKDQLKKQGVQFQGKGNK